MIFSMHCSAVLCYALHCLLLLYALLTYCILPSYFQSHVPHPVVVQKMGASTEQLTNVEVCIHLLFRSNLW